MIEYYPECLVVNEYVQRMCYFETKCISKGVVLLLLLLIFKLEAAKVNLRIGDLAAATNKKGRINF